MYIEVSQNQWIDVVHGDAFKELLHLPNNKLTDSWKSPNESDGPIRIGIG